MSGKLDRLHFPADVELFYSFAEVGYRRMGDVIRSEDVDRFLDLIKGVNILDSEDGQCLIVARVEQSEADAGLQPEGINLLLGDIKGDWHGEQCAICESHILDHANQTLQISGYQSAIKENANLS